MYVIVTNHVNWHRENLRSDWEKAGNLKVQFEWCPSIASYYSGRTGKGTLKKSFPDDNFETCLKQKYLHTPTITKRAYL